MKVFLSHPMSNLSEKDVNIIRNRALHKITEKYKDEFIEIIDNYHHYELPEGSSTELYFAASINQMVRADLIYFCLGWKNANGCKLEREICEIYPNLTVKIEEEGE